MSCQSNRTSHQTAPNTDTSSKAMISRVTCACVSCLSSSPVYSERQSAALRTHQPGFGHTGEKVNTDTLFFIDFTARRKRRQEARKMKPWRKSREIASQVYGRACLAGAYHLHHKKLMPPSAGSGAALRVIAGAADQRHRLNVPAARGRQRGCMFLRLLFLEFKRSTKYFLGGYDNRRRRTIIKMRAKNSSDSSER